MPSKIIDIKDVPERQNEVLEILETSAEVVEHRLEDMEAWDVGTNAPTLYKDRLTVVFRDICRCMVRDKVSYDVALRLTNHTHHTAGRWEWAQTQPIFHKVKAEQQELWDNAGDITRRDVVEGLREAIDLAQLKEEPSAMVAGWREIGKVVGVYEPKEVKVTHNGTIQHQLEQLEQLSDEELLAISSDEVIEGEVIHENAPTKVDTTLQDTTSEPEQPVDISEEDTGPA